MIELGGTYRADDTDYQCIYVCGGYAWMTKAVDRGATAYVWTTDGASLSLGKGYDISFDPRDEEIARLKARIAELEAEQHRQEPRHDK
jgi:hypothetical protein